MLWIWLRSGYSPHELRPWCLTIECLSPISLWSRVRQTAPAKSAKPRPAWAEPQQKSGELQIRVSECLAQSGRPAGGDILHIVRKIENTHRYGKPLKYVPLSNDLLCDRNRHKYVHVCITPWSPDGCSKISNFLLHQLTAALQCLPGHKELIAKLIFSTDFYHRLVAGGKCMVHGFLSSAPHKNVFIIVSLQAFFIMNIALGAGHCLSVCGHKLQLYVVWCLLFWKILLFPFESLFTLKVFLFTQTRKCFNV